VDFVTADAAQSDSPETLVVDKVKSLSGKVVVLVNNVGGVHTSPAFLTLDAVVPADVDAQINTNARFPIQLTRSLLPLLAQNKPALILNCGSVGAIFGVPYITTYCASKGFVHSFTKALKNELAAEDHARDVEVMGFVIGNVRTTGNPSTMPFTISAKACVRGCLARVGSGKTLAYASWIHGLQVELMSLLPEKTLQGLLAPEMRKRKDEASKAQ